MSTTKRCISLLLVAIMMLGILLSSEWTVIAKALPQKDVFLSAPPVPESESVEPMDTTADGLEYRIYSDHIEITKYTGNAAEVIIPESIEGLPVSSIGYEAFRGCSNLTKITFPARLTSIGDFAFHGCNSLESPVLPSELEEIGRNAFVDCINLRKINLPSKLHSIGVLAFIGCSNLTSINVAEGNSTYRSADGVLYSVDGTKLICCPAGKIGCIQIPEGVTSIGFGAFEDCSKLTSVVISDSVTTIGEWAFSGCTSMTSINLPDSVVTIEGYAFYDCSNLSEVFLGCGIQQIKESAFSDCDNLRKVHIADLKQWCQIQFGPIGGGSAAFYSNPIYYADEIYIDGELVTDLVIPGEVVNLAKATFSNYDKLEKVTFSDGLVSIGRYAFLDCDSLNTIEMPNSLSYIYAFAFGGCDSLTEVTIPASVGAIGIRAFADCTNLSRIIFSGDAPAYDYSIHVIGASNAIFDGVTATAYYPAHNSTWTTSIMQSYGGNITWVPFELNDMPNNGTYTSPQESVWYNIWCVGVSRFDAEKNFNLNVGDQTYPTGDSWKARADIPIELAEQVSISKDGWITCEIPRELVYTCREIVLHPDNTEGPFAQFIVARNNGDSMYVNLACSHLSVYENAMRTYDMYVDIDWNGYTPGKIYLKQGDKTLDLKEGKNQGLLFGMFSTSGGEVKLCWETGEGTVYSQGLYLDIYKNSTSNMKLDSGESISGTNPASEVEDEMWGNLSFSMNLFNDSVPVELELSPTGLNKGTFKGTIGVKFENADDKKTVIELLDTNLNKNWDYWTFDSLKKTLNAKYPETLIPQQATSFVISADTQLIGVVEGTYELGADGSLVDMQLTDSKILSSVDGKFSVTRQHIVTPVPWYWTLELKAGFELALELQNEYDGTAASIAPLNSEVKVGIGAKAAVGVSGAASVGVKGGGNVYVAGQVLPIDFSKTEIYSTYDISLYGEFGPFKGDVFPYKSDKYYIWKNGKWVFSTNPSTGGGGFRDSIPDSGFEMQQISRDYLNNATPSYDVHSVQLNSIADVSTENLVKANTYTFTEPQIVQLDNGNLLLVWVDDPGMEVRPVDVNRAALFYSVYDGSTWSEPAMVSDDGTADASPVLKNIDGNVYLLWTNANAVFGEATDYEEYCASLDIAYARFNTANAAFTDVTVIDTNESCDILPDMTLVNGVPTVVWIQNDANDPFQASGGNKLYAASRKAGNWSVTVLADDLMVVDGLAVTGNGDVLNVYISQDTDGDMSTVEDRELFRVSENTVSQVTDNDTADLKPTLIDDSLYWYQNGVLTDGTQIVQFAEDTDRYVTTGNGTDSAVLYQRFNEDDSVTICANILHDSVWSDVVELVTIDRYLQKFDAVMADDGSITIITNEVELNDNVYQQADLCSYVFGQKCDIAVQQIYLNPLSMAPGGEMELFVTLKNMGTAGTGDVYARIYDGANLLKEDLLSDMLDAGTEATVILTYPIEEGFGSESLRVEFWPESVTDGNEENNTADCEISYADVSVEELTAIQSEGTTHVSAYISNRGLTELSGVEVILYTKIDDRKTVVDSCTISSLAVGKGEPVSFDAPFEIDTVVYMEAVVADEEFNFSNNVEYTIVTEASDLQLAAKQDNPFTDVEVGSFYYDPVMWAIENGITNGTSATTFGPNDQCMRAHVVTFLWRAVGSPEPTRTDNPFVDVKSTDFYYKPVLWAVENGITAGLDATHFGPTAYCNRAQVVTFLYRTMGSPDVGAATNPFTDVAAGSFYEKPVLWAVENGVTAGLSATSFGPNSICNRAQIVTFLYRAFVD